MGGMVLKSNSKGDFQFKMADDIRFIRYVVVRIHSPQKEAGRLAWSLRDRAVSNK